MIQLIQGILIGVAGTIFIEALLLLWWTRDMWRDN